jgi:hypothetical protein
MMLYFKQDKKMKDRKIHDKKPRAVDHEALMGHSEPGRWQRLTLWVKKKLGINIFLCKTCRWDWRSACHNHERPNATWCPDYQKKG